MKRSHRLIRALLLGAVTLLYGFFFVAASAEHGRGTTPVVGVANIEVEGHHTYPRVGYCAASEVTYAARELANAAATVAAVVESTRVFAASLRCEVGHQRRPQREHRCELDLVGCDGVSLNE